MDCLTPSEWQQIRIVFTDVMHDKPWITRPYELQRVCAELGISADLDEIERFMDDGDGKVKEVDFMLLLDFIAGLKRRFTAPEPRDSSTMRAFMAVAGEHVFDGSATSDEPKMSVEALIQACKEFDLALDDSALEQLNGSQISYGQFKEMFRDDDHPHQSLKLGHDYASLVAKEEVRRSHERRCSHTQRKGRRLTGRGSVYDQRRASGVPPPHGAVGGGGGGGGGMSALLAVQPPGGAYTNPSRAAGGGAPVHKPAADELPPIEAEFPDTDVPKKRKKKNRGASPRGRKAAGHTLDANTKQYGRTGVYLDESLRDSFFPSLPGRKQLVSAPLASPILARMDARVELMKSGRSTFM